MFNVSRKILAALLLVSLVATIAIPVKKTEASSLPVAEGGIEAAALAYWSGAVYVASVDGAIGVKPELQEDIQIFAKSMWDDAPASIKTSITESTYGMQDGWNTSNSYVVSWTPRTLAYLQDKWYDHFGGGATYYDNKVIADIMGPGAIIRPSSVIAQSNAVGEGNIGYMANGQIRAIYVDISGKATIESRSGVNPSYSGLLDLNNKPFANARDAYNEFVTRFKIEKGTYTTKPIFVDGRTKSRYVEVIFPSSTVFPNSIVMPAPQGVLNADYTVKQYKTPTIGRAGGVITGQIVIGFPSVTGNFAALTKANASNYTFLSYDNAKRNGSPAPYHSIVENARSLPVTGIPYSSKDHIKQGQLEQRRYYGSDGRAELDIDYTNHGNTQINPNVPHRHDWNYNSKPQRGPWYIVETDSDYSYNQLVEDLNTGHEVSFTFENVKYYITENQGSWFLMKSGEIAPLQSASTPSQLLSLAILNNESLQSLFIKGSLVNISVY
ncbi:hypothetical protein ABEW34_14465 [Paenibacillus algorifonticola]|uniref:hypothetical protein n=1 Tax=Paenibacillus algorifonticola TaxID=684063 RepID=UPI003D2D15F1